LNAGIDAACTADVAGCCASNRSRTSRVPAISSRRSCRGIYSGANRSSRRLPSPAMWS